MLVKLKYSALHRRLYMEIKNMYGRYSVMWFIVLFYIPDNQVSSHVRVIWLEWIQMMNERKTNKKTNKQIAIGCGKILSKS